MSENDSAFMDVLASCTQACAGMKLDDDQWMPPDGNYDVIVVEVPQGTKQDKETGVVNGWIKPTFQIIDGEFAGKTFTDYFWIKAGLEEPSIAIKNLCRFATCISGHPVTDPIEAGTIAAASSSEALSLQVFSTVGKKGRNVGRVFQNVRYLQLLTAVAAEAK